MTEKSERLLRFSRQELECMREGVAMYRKMCHDQKERNPKVRYHAKNEETARALVAQLDAFLYAE